MFEKEAEEWIKENMDCCRTESCTGKDIPYFDEEERCCAKSAFKDGAEFGYNKANEWHFVKDGDLPAENIYLIIRLNDENTCYKYCTGFWEKEEKCFHTLFCSVVDTKDIIAWKEIVPPEEIKENE